MMADVLKLTPHTSDLLGRMGLTFFQMGLLYPGRPTGCLIEGYFAYLMNSRFSSHVMRMIAVALRD
ncbi:hypothetical protein Brsp01_06120 [Brucella sp. NBRC 12950]|nr:hypothetical protein Brsp01_06120 [Brucella sp. NBRC 12950]